MKATARYVDPESVVVALTLTMTVAQWRALRSQLSTNYPSWKLKYVIDAVTRPLETILEEPIEPQL